MKVILIAVLLFCNFLSFSQRKIADSLITEGLLKYYVRALSDDSMQGRYTGTLGWEKAKEFIYEEMKAIGLQSIDGTDSGYFHHFTTHTTETINGTNIIGFLPGKRTDTFLLFSAHFDHVGTWNDGLNRAQFKSTRRDTIYNGANDNASGVAAMLAIAGYFKALEDREYSILFVAFSSEEDGLWGSEALAKDFTDVKLIKQVINLEMLGRQSYIQPFVTEGINSIGFTKTLNKKLKDMDPKAPKNYFSVDRERNERLLNEVIIFHLLKEVFLPIALWLQLRKMNFITLLLMNGTLLILKR